MELSEGRLLKERYRVIHKLGKGGMGTAYLVEDLGEDGQPWRKCVAKVSMLDSEAHGKQFEREARILATLNHSNLPKVYDYFVDNGCPCLIMEYIEGKTLDELAEAKGVGKPFKVDQVLRWANDLLDALDCLHSQRPPIIHRDIKPQNVCITHTGEVVLLDFGIARRLDHTHTHTGAQARSRFYSPIEQWTAESVGSYEFLQQYLQELRAEGFGTGPYSDIYSLGATLYFALTLLDPPDACLRKIEEGLRPIRDLNPDVPDYMVRALGRALAIDPRSRCQTVTELRQLLRLPTSGPADRITKIAVETNVQIVGPSVKIDAGKRGLMRPLALAIGVCVILLVVVAGLILSDWIGPILATQTIPTEVSVVRHVTPTPTDTATVVPPTTKPVSTSTPFFSPTASPTLLPTSSPPPTLTPSPTATVVPTPTSTPFFTVSDGRLDVYAGPGEVYGTLGQVQEGDKLPIRGRSEDGEWWQVGYLGWEGWVEAQSPIANIDAEALPVVETPPPPAITSSEKPLAQCDLIADHSYFFAVWRQENVGARLGCPLDEVQNIGSTSELFQQGFMYWREDLRRIYVVYNDGHWQKFTDTWTPDQSEPTDYSPPVGLDVPKRGFGKVWREELGGPWAAIGWATEEEWGMKTSVQDFEHGVILEIGPSIYSFYVDDMTWKKHQLHPPPGKFSPINAFGQVWYEGQLRQVLGWAIAGEGLTFAAEQFFEQGVMFWRKDTDQIYGLIQDGSWRVYEGTWKEGMDEYSCPEVAECNTPPTPKRGFGEIWCLHMGGPNAAIGWAKTEEEGYDALWQAFEHGLIWQGRDGKVYVLYETGTWQMYPLP